jgi:hypothetical protein
MSRKSDILIEKRNSEVFLRPRFSIDLEKNYSEILQDFTEALSVKEAKYSGHISDGHIFISVAKKDEYFWSPQLHLEIVEVDKNKSELKGLFGPKPQVWTLFMFIHFIIGMSFLGFGVLLYTRWSLNESLFFPLSMLVVLPFIWTVLYFLGKIGKDTGKKQMTGLHDFMISVLNN